jgi:hypothetical protein
MDTSRWVYYTVAYHHRLNAYRRFLLTANDLAQAERTVLVSLPDGWTMHRSEMVCSSADAPFFKEL